MGKLSDYNVFFAVMGLLVLACIVMVVINWELAFPPGEDEMGVICQRECMNLVNENTTFYKLSGEDLAMCYCQTMKIDLTGDIPVLSDIVNMGGK